MCMNNFGKYSEWILLIILVLILCSCQGHAECGKRCC